MRRRLDILHAWCEPKLLHIQLRCCKSGGALCSWPIGIVGMVDRFTYQEKVSCTFANNRERTKPACSKPCLCLCDTRHFRRFRGSEERSPSFSGPLGTMLIRHFRHFRQNGSSWQKTKTRFTKNTVCATPKEGRPVPEDLYLLWSEGGISSYGCRPLDMSRELTVACVCFHTLWVQSQACITQECVYIYIYTHMYLSHSLKVH